MRELSRKYSQTNPASCGLMSSAIARHRMPNQTNRLLKSKQTAIAVRETTRPAVFPTSTSIMLVQRNIHNKADAIKGAYFAACHQIMKVAAYQPQRQNGNPYNTRHLPGKKTKRGNRNEPRWKIDVGCNDSPLLRHYLRRDLPSPLP